MDALWSDVSEFQVPVDDSYPYEVLAIRSDDGTYRDHNWTANYGWARRALAFGKLKILIVYLVYRPNWRDELAVIKDMMGTPPDQSVVMVDVESWNGQITGDHSVGINALVAELTHWIGPRRVIGYGNTGDLNSIWPTKPQGMRLVIAGYGSNPDYPGKLAHQFTDGIYGGPIRVPPFGMADVNCADGYDVEQLAEALGLNLSTRYAGRERPMLHLEPTTTTTGTPDATWTSREETITMVGPVGGWAGRQLVHFTPGNGGAWIQEAWFGPSGTHVVSPDKPTLVKQFDTQGWEAPKGSRVFVIRFASRSLGSLTLETEH